MHNYDKIKIAAIGVAFAAASAFPALAIAQSTTPTQPTSTQQPPARGICINIDKVSNGMVGLANNHNTSFQGKQREAVKNLIEQKELNYDKLKWARMDADMHRQANFDRLSEKATTDAQKQAVAVFKTAMESAVKARRDKVDAAIKVYRDGLAALVKTRQTTTDAAVKKMQDAVKTATDMAKTACAAADADPVAIKQNLHEKMKWAKMDFDTARKTLDADKAKLEALKKTRDTSIKAAMDEFKTATTAAQATLKAAFAAK
jgi:hypothetical protein